MYRKILAPLDGSNLAECTIEHVKEIAKGCSIPEVVFLFVVDVARNAYWAAELAPNGDLLMKAEEAQKEGAEEYISKVVDAAKKEGLEAKGVIVEGSPADAIIDYASKNGVDLIVMSTHGRSGVTRFALGSVTDKVVRVSVAPVLVVSPAGCRVTI
jgi:nucleotide-binding universal stress UspA family protein